MRASFWAYAVWSSIGVDSISKKEGGKKLSLETTKGEEEKEKKEAKRKKKGFRCNVLKVH